MFLILFAYNNIPCLRLIEFIYKVYEKNLEFLLNNQFKVLYNKISINLGVFKMKLRFLFVAIMALLVSGCMDSMMAVPEAAVSGVSSVVGGVWSALTSIF